MCATQPTPLLDSLVRLFNADLAQLGTFEEVSSEKMARDYRMLLAHHDHMTVTVERYHNDIVNLEVLETARQGNHYARKILLRRNRDNAVVQFGIMRIGFRYVADDVRGEIESKSIPLGRILIDHNVLRDVHLGTLWRVTPGPEMQRYFGLSAPVVTYGRTALIECEGQPAIELLEIVAPLAEVLEGLGLPTTAD